MEQVFLGGAIVSYLDATVTALMGVAVQSDVPRQLMPRILWAALAVHAAAIVDRSIETGHIAITTFGEALSGLGVLLVAVFLVVQARRPLMALGAVVSPLAFGLALA